MNTSELIKLVNERMGLKESQSRALGETTLKAFWKTLGKSDGFNIPGFGTFGTTLNPKRKAFSPHHEKFMILPQKQVISFKPSQLLKIRVKEKNSMSDKITFGELIETIVHETDVPKTKVRQFIKELAEVLEEGLLRDGIVRVYGFGTFKLKWYKQRQGRNPQTGEPLTIPAHSRVVFHPQKRLRDFVNRRYYKLIPEFIKEDPLNLPETDLADEDWSGDESDGSDIALNSEQLIEHSKNPVKQKKVYKDQFKEVSTSKIVEGLSEDLKTNIISSHQPQPAQEEATTNEEKQALTSNDEPKKPLPLKWFAIAAALLLIGGLYLMNLSAVNNLFPSGDSSITIEDNTINTDTEEPIIASDKLSEVDEVEQETVASNDTNTTNSDVAVVPTDNNNVNLNDRNETLLNTDNVATADHKMQEPQPVLKPVTAVGTKGGTHTIESGDNLWNVSKMFYEDTLLWPNIFRANSIINDPDTIYSGNSIDVPSLEGNPLSLSQIDRQNLALGYFKAYKAYKKKGKPSARFYLWAAFRRNPKVVEARLDQIDEKDRAFLDKIK